MYVPAHFAVTDLPVLHDFIDSHPFGLLVTAHDGRPFVTHLPLLLDRGTGPHGALRGHVARQNPHWQSMVGQDVLVVFNGPHAYVSPTWYAAEKVVPTWNYSTVHAHGRLVSCLEGGYNVETLAEGVQVHLEELLAFKG